jgi:hypothetical protein
MCLAGYPEKHTPRLYPRHKQDQPIPLLSRVSRSPSKLGLLAPVLETRPQYGAKTSTYPRIQSVGPERAGAHDKRVTRLLSPHPLVYARDNKTVTWPGSMQQTILNWHGQENSATQSCPVAAGHNLLHPPIPIPHPCPVAIFFPSFYPECNNNNMSNLLLWVTTGYSL